MRKDEGRRGSALILALIVILVLSIIGIGVAYLTTTEDRMSGNVKATKTSFYAAEAGLRNGENLLGNYVSKGGKIDALFDITKTTSYSPPGGGWTAYMLMINSAAVKDVAIQSVPGDPHGRYVYTLYVRNNQDDTLGTATHDTDSKLNIIAVGEYVVVDSTDPTKVVSRGIQKILEEQVNMTPTGAMINTQKGVNPAGTGSGTY